MGSKGACLCCIVVHIDYLDYVTCSFSRARGFCSLHVVTQRRAVASCMPVMVRNLIHMHMHADSSTSPAGLGHCAYGTLGKSPQLTLSFFALSRQCLTGASAPNFDWGGGRVTHFRHFSAPFGVFFVWGGGGAAPVPIFWGGGRPLPPVPTPLSEDACAWCRCRDRRSAASCVPHLHSHNL